MLKAIILDTETTGFDDPEVIELSTSASITPGGNRPPAIATLRYRPTKPIALGAKAAHGIDEQDLLDYDPMERPWTPPSGVQYIIGHNIDYDWRALGSPNIPRICTLALARYTWPKLDAHTLGATMYHLFPAPRARALVRRAHSAEADVRMTWLLLVQLIKDNFPEVPTWEQLHALSELARIPTVMPFGKHKGVPIVNVPSDYKAWLLRQDDIDPYLEKALKGVRQNENVER